MSAPPAPATNERREFVRLRPRGLAGSEATIHPLIRRWPTQTRLRRSVPGSPIRVSLECRRAVRPATRPLRRSPGGPRRSSSRATRNHDETPPRDHPMLSTAPPRCHLTPARSRSSPLRARNATLANRVTHSLIVTFSRANYPSENKSRTCIRKCRRAFHAETRQRRTSRELDQHSALERPPSARQPSRRLPTRARIGLHDRHM